MDRRRLLLLLSQNPLDAASGAARTVDAIARLLAVGGGYEVEVLGTASSDFRSGDKAPTDLAVLVTSAGARDLVSEAVDKARVLRFSRGPVRYTLVDAGQWRATYFHDEHSPRFDALFDEILRRFEPHVVFTFGAMPPEQARQRRAREHGSAVVLGVRQHGYYDPRCFDHVDAVLTCSEFLTRRYREKVGVESVAIPSPLLLEDVVAAEYDPVFVTFVNPSPDKGVVFFARLAEELATRRPDIPMLVVESRGTSADLMAAGREGGFDLARHTSLMISPGVASPRDIFAPTRLLLAPSVWDEPWGRVAAEALLNAVPPIVSDRGGLAEACNGGGFVLPLPADMTPETRIPPPATAVEPWLDLICRLCDDEAAYAAACDNAHRAGDAYRPGRLLPRYVEFFDNVRMMKK